jgi:hypothetical protein
LPPSQPAPSLPRDLWKMSLYHVTSLPPTY